MIPTLWRTRTPTVWDDLFNTRRDFDRFLDRFTGSDETLSAWAPVVDVQDNADKITITAELPGVNANDVQVVVQNGVLTVSGEKHDGREEGKPGSGAYLVERRYGKFERSFALPRSVAADQVKADFNNGVLVLSLPKSEQSKPRRIEVQGVNGDAKKQQ